MAEYRYPFSDIVQNILDAITRSFALVLDECATIEDISEFPDQLINSQFQFLSDRYNSGSNYRKDPHLTAVLTSARDSFNAKDGSVFKGKSRISALIKRNFIDVLREKPRRKNDSIVWLPSPFKVAYELLTVPEEPASRAYAFYCLRQFLTEKTSVFLEKSLIGSENIGTEGCSTLTYGEVRSVLENIEKHHTRGGDAFDFTNSPQRHFVYLAMSIRGMVVPRFKVHRASSADGEKLQPRERVARILNVGSAAFFDQDSHPDLTYGRNRRKSLDEGNCKLELIQSPTFNDLPSLAEISNELWGIPVPIRGADIIFSGGLKPASDNGLVVGVAGTPGSGKTSFALALATAWAPLGTKTFYLTLEEEVADLKVRQSTLRPVHLAQTSFFGAVDETQWFFPEKLPYGSTEYEDAMGGIEIDDFEDRFESRNINRLEVLNSALIELLWEKEQVDKSIDDGPLSEAVPQLPALIVLDGLQDFLGADQDISNAGKAVTDSELAEFIENCRRLNAVVMLLSAPSQLELDPLERLVDVSIHIEHRNTDDAIKKAYRAFSLKKTRHQISRPGTSICHLGSEKGFRISPQLASQADRKSHLKPRLAGSLVSEQDNTRFSYLNRATDQGDGVNRFVDTYPNSHILVHGRGSTGKASFGLQTLCCPLSFDDATGSERIDPTYNPRVLVISFLYPNDYYQRLVTTTSKSLRKIYRSANIELGPEFDPDIEVIHCHPGYLQPEDLYSKINTEIDRAELSGEPYTGLLLDGTHNVFLQFPLLEQHGTIWPMLYSAMRTRDRLQVVTTHTTISVGQGVDIEKIYQIRDDKPFLIALLQSSDFYFEINQYPEAPKQLDFSLINQAISIPIQHYIVQCVTAISQKVPLTRLAWDKSTGSIELMSATDG